MRYERSSSVEPVTVTARAFVERPRPRAQGSANATSTRRITRQPFGKNATDGARRAAQSLPPQGSRNGILPPNSASSAFQPQGAEGVGRCNPEHPTCSLLS